MGVIIVLYIFKSIIVARLRRMTERSKTDADDVLIGALQSIGWPFYLMVALWFAAKTVALAPAADKAIHVLFVIAVTYGMMRAVVHMVDYGMTRYINRNKEEGESDEHTRAVVRNARMVAKTVVWIVGLLLVLSNLNVDVSSLVASLGIGGIAVALALQNVLSDMFSSFFIYLDKPFKVGDFIVVGENSGTVQRIGLKTTRVKTLQGEELVISNKELTTERAQNFKKLERRRVLFSLGVEYGTSAAKLEKIPALIKEIIGAIEGIEFGRCHFSGYGDFSLNFETVFHVESSSYETYMDLKQQINLAIYRAFEKEKIAFAYPTQTVYVKK